MAKSAASLPDPTTDKPPRPRRCILLSLRMFVAINGVIGLLSVFSLWFVYLRPMQIHSKTYHRISDSVQSLAHRRPAAVSKKQWSFIIGWTMNGIGNCCSVDGYLNKDEASHKRFLSLPDRFDERLREDVSMETIDWLWDELEIISKYGVRYSQHWRPTTPERLAEADSTSVGSSGPDVD